MQTTRLDLSKCPKSVLDNLPENMEVRGWLDIFLCQSLTSLPEGLKVKGVLILTYCWKLKSIPEDLKVGGEILINPNDYGGTGVKKEDFPERLWKQIKED